MKALTRNIILLAAMIATLCSVSASAQTLRDASYNYVGKIAPNGTVRNSEYGAVGFFNNDGTIANARGKVVGRVDRKMQFFDKAGNPCKCLKGYAKMTRPATAWDLLTPTAQ